MWEALGAWLIGIISKVFFDWALIKIKAYQADQNSYKEIESSEDAQAKLDLDKTSKLTKDSTGNEVSEAIDDASQHI